MERQPDRHDVLALGPPAEPGRPGLDLVRNRFPVGEHSAVMRLERDLLALHVLPGRGRSGHGTLYQMSDRDESVRKARYNADQVVRELLAASQGETASEATS